MENFTVPNKQLYTQCLNGFNNWVSNTIDLPIVNILGIHPTELETFFSEIKGLTRLIGGVPTDPGANTRIAECISPKDQAYLKRALLYTIQTRSFENERRSNLTTNPDIKERLDAEVQEIIALTTGEWFSQIEAYKPPKITDFLTLEQATAHVSNVLIDRKFDEKFHILTAPELFPDDIRYYRSACELRGRPLTLAFLYIDDFKNFNDEHGHSKVDRVVLPKFMVALEAHVYSHGHTYRFGGDEYVVLLSNMHHTTACQLLADSQSSLAQLDYFEVGTRPTVSIGVMGIDDECHLTDNECLTMAENAKEHAKATQKGSIYVNTGSRQTDDSFELYP